MVFAMASVCQDPTGRFREGVKTIKKADRGQTREGDEVSSVRRMSDLEPMAPTMRMLAIDEDLLALARGDRGETILDPTAHPGAEDDPFDGLIPVFDDSASMPPPERTASTLDLTAVPRITMADDELRSLPLDHRHGFVLCRVDGQRSLAKIATMAGLPREKICGIVELLLALGVIEMT
jgi:hypothetical protein